MADITVLSRDISELIAAGEVIERPSSVIKELLENSVDAGARHVTVEIKNGGTTYMRVTDDGCGIAPEQVATAFLRHATSKITSKDDLDNILTLGFRGEALASISAVSQVELLTKQRENEYGVSYVIEGGREVSSEQSGCPDGTTIIIRNIFYNVPVRRKFMKRDSAEANAVLSILQKITLSHPETAFKFIKDNKVEFASPGDGELYSAIFSIYGRDFAHDLIPVNYSEGSISVKGFVVKPLYSRANRSFQNFFVNGRYVRSVTCTSSLEEAYQNLVMVGRYPACVLMLEIPPVTVDVNIHPAKAEVRFSDEKVVFDSIYFAVKNALMEAGLIYEFNLGAAEKKRIDYTAEPFVPEDFEQQKISAPAEEITLGRVSESEYSSEDIIVEPDDEAVQPFDDSVDSEEDESIPAAEEETERFSYIGKEAFVRREPEPAAAKSEEPPIKVIGEFFRNYIAAQSGENIVIIDKHAAHERVIFERLKSRGGCRDSQLLLDPAEILLSEAEYGAVSDNISVLEDMGFDIDLSNEPFVKVKAVPSSLESLNMDEVVPEIAENLILCKRDPQTHFFDSILHTLACKAAVRANDKNDIRELQHLAEEVFGNEKIRHCPHGRPVMFVLSRYELEKQFKRIV